tara:strand:- start:790 stop:1722 length:933 start_codon:yes stop_codon:yes gene_type:complete
MPKFFQVEKAAYAGEKDTFSNVKFKKSNTESSNAAEAGTILEIIPIHIKNPPVIQFLAYIETLSDKVSTEHTAEQPYGRPDPYYIWKSNSRTINVVFNVPSSSVAMGLNNLNNLSWFFAAQYPTYKGNQVTTAISATPMFRVRFANLICSSTKGGQGLLGVLNGLSVTPDFESGFISVNSSNAGSVQANVASQLLAAAGFDENVPEGKKLLIPKLFKLSFDMKVVHDHSLGWDHNDGTWRGGFAASSYPYDFGLIRESVDPPGAGATAVEAPGSPAAVNTAAAQAPALGGGSSTVALDEANSATGLEESP